MILLRTRLTNSRFTSFFQKYSTSDKNNRSSTSSSSDSSDDEQKNIQQKSKSMEARQKLNLLLNSMLQGDKTVSSHTKLDLAKPKNHRKKGVKAEPGVESVKTESVEKQVIKAVKNVAESIGGDTKRTESELLQKLLSPVQEDTKQSSSDDLNSLFKNLKIDKGTGDNKEVSRAEQVRQLLRMNKNLPEKRSRPRKESQIRDEGGYHATVQERINLFGDQRLDIFPINEIKGWPEQNYNKTWNELHLRELRLTITHPPANYFREMILWTEQKKLWKFPIDNEQDYGEEKTISFAEHIFLEKHLEPWCPPKGPVRHFMELVCVGLSKNPYLTVAKKKENILWYKNYFYEKKELLKEVGAVSSNFGIEDTNEIKKST